MGEIDPRLASALSTQLERWRATLRGGATRVGWKLGMGERESIGGEVVIGHLTSATRLDDRSTYHGGDTGALHADVEVMLELGRDIPPDADVDAVRDAIAGFGVALEIVDLASPPDDPESVVAENVFHRGVAFGPSFPTLPGDVEARLLVNGEVRAAAPAADDYVDKVVHVARLLDAMGEGLKAGDRIITGSVVQVPVRPGDVVVAELGALGRVRLSIAP